MPRKPIEAASYSARDHATRMTASGPIVRTLTLGGSTFTTGLIAGLLYAYAVSVNLSLAEQADASYIAAMQAINEKIQNPLFFLSFFGALLFLVAALVAHYRRPRSSCFWLVVLACILYVGGSFLLTVLVNVPLNEELARVATNASADELARARALYEGPWNFWNGVRTVCSILAFLTLIAACLLREGDDPRLGGGLR